MVVIASIAANSNSTASAEKNEVLEALVENLNALGKIKPLKAIFAPSEDTVRALHEYANAAEEPDKELLTHISEAFSEMGIQIAEALRALKVKSTSGYKGILQRAANFAQVSLAKLKKQTDKAQDTVSEKIIAGLNGFLSRKEVEIRKNMQEGKSYYPLTIKQQKGRPNLEVRIENPLKLFEYIDLAYQRNKILKKPVDSRIKGLVLLAHCIRKDIEAKEPLAIERQPTAKEIGLKPRSIGAEAEKWNQAIARGGASSAISDYMSLLNPAAIQKRNKVIADYNATRGNSFTVDTLERPNDLLRYLMLTKRMQTIKLFIDNKPTDEQNTNFRSLDIVAQWYLQLGGRNPELSLINYAKNEYGIEGESDLHNIKRDKHRWNKEKLTA